MRSKSGTKDPAPVRHLPGRGCKKCTGRLRLCPPDCHVTARWHLFIPVFFILVLLLSAPVHAAANAQVSVSASPSVIVAGGTSTVTVTVSHENTGYPSDISRPVTYSPLPGATVSLSTTSPGITFSPASGETDSRGMFASTLFTSRSASGSVPVHASVQLSNDFSGEGSATVTVQRPTVTPATATPAVTRPPVNQPPLAVIRVDRNAGEAPLAVTFDGQGSFDPDGSIAGYRWDFGDGTSGDGYVTTHQYARPGSYTALLVVTDAKGLSSGESTVQITVSGKDKGDIPAPGFVDVSFVPLFPVAGDPLVITARYLEPVPRPCLDIIADNVPLASCSDQMCRAVIPRYTAMMQVSVKFCTKEGTISVKPVIIPEKKDVKVCPVTDRDCDGIPNEQDNCPDVENKEQYDSEKCCFKTPGGKTQYLGCVLFFAPVGTELPRPPELFSGDGIGDACDYCPCLITSPADNMDPDKDGLGNACDNCKKNYNPDQEDSDKDGIGDACDACPGFSDSKDQDKDGEPDACDCNDGFEGPQETGWDCGGPCGPCDPCTISPLPARFDWRDWRGRDWVTGARDQGQCGSCWAFGAAAVTEARYNIESNSQKMPMLNLSEQYLVSYHEQQAGLAGYGDCYGGSETRSLNEIKQDGIIEEPVLPYTSGSCALSQYTPAKQGCNMSQPMANCKGCDATWCKLEYCDSSCAAKDGSKYYHCANPPVRPAIVALTRWKIDYFERPTKVLGNYAQLGSTLKRSILCEGPHTATTPSWVGGGHVVLITGWNDTWDNGTGAWIIKNSWGENWIAGPPYGDAGPGYGYVGYYCPSGGNIVNWTYFVRNVKKV